MQIFTQTVFTIGRIEPQGIAMLGTGFMTSDTGLVATTYHTIASTTSGLVVLMPSIKNFSEYQDLSNTDCVYVNCTVEEIDPFHDIAILKTDIKSIGQLPMLGSFDGAAVGEDIAVFGFPHCVEGRRCLTYQRASIGAKVLIDTEGIKSKHAVINIQTRPGQSGSVIVSFAKGTILGMLIGAWTPGLGGISLAGINPKELHQTTHCVSAEYIRKML